MSKPKVSVLMPIYNTPLEHLKESIESILNQTFADFEFLIVNDSPENEALDEFVNNFDDERIRYFKNEKNQGIEFSTNFLIKQAQGKYLAIFDHDDISLPERLEKEVAFLDANSDYGMVSGQFEVFGVENWTSQNPLSDDEIKELLKTTSCVSHTSLMICAETLRQNKIRYEKKFFPAASYRIITRLAAVTKVANLPDIVLRYRMDGNNTSLKFANQRIEARAKIQAEYKNELRLQKLITSGKFDKIQPIKTDSMSGDDNHYYAEKSSEKFFIKESVRSFNWEFEATKRAFLRSKDHFSEPIEVFQEGNYNYIVLRWENGENLNKLIKKSKLNNKQIKSFIEDLKSILDCLDKVKLVHRDIIPRNFMIVDGKLKLVDFYFAVDFEDYKEYDYIENDLSLISDLGEGFSKDYFVWDDAYSAAKIIEFIGGKVSDEISKKIGLKVVSPKNEVFARNIIQRRDQIILLMKEKEILQNEILNKDSHINELHEQLRKLNEEKEILQNEILNKDNHINELHEQLRKLNEEKEEILNSKAYRFGQKAARVYRKIKF